MNRVLRFCYFSGMNYLNLSLKNFEELIDNRILERGFEIYKNDQILSIEKIDEDYWEAIVQGNENYEVSIHLREDSIKNSNCNCPYNMSPYCKHEVAILNFIKYSDLAQKSKTGKMEEIQNILNNFSSDQTKKVLFNILKENRNIRNKFLQSY